MKLKDVCNEVLDGAKGMVLLWEDSVSDKPKNTSVSDMHCKRCAKVGLTFFLALGLLFAGCKGCFSESKKTTLPVRSEAGR